MTAQLLSFGVKANAARTVPTSAIAPLFELFNVAANRRFPHLLPDGERALKMGDAIDWCAKRNVCSVRTIYRKIAFFRINGEMGSESIPRADKGSFRFFTRYQKAAAMGAYLNIAWGVSSRAVHMAILRNRELLEIPAKGGPSYETVRNWLRSSASEKIPLALEGQRSYRDTAFSYFESGVLLPARQRRK